MDHTLKQQLETCFFRGGDPADCYGAIPIMEEHLNEIDFYDDDDLEAIVDIALRSLRTENADTKFIEYLISKGFDINTKLLKKDCLILKAVDNWVSPALIEKLVSLGADIYSETSDGDNVLLLAAKKEYKDSDYAPENEEESLSGDGSSAGTERETAVYLATHYDLSLLDKTDRFGISPLMYAAMLNHMRLTHAMIENGADVNVQGTSPVGGNSYWLKMDGVTPLALACRHGNVEITKMLLEAGADETLCDAKGNPPIFSLIRYPFRFFQQRQFNHPIFDRKCKILSMLKEYELTDSAGYTVLLRSLTDSRDTFDKADAYDNLPITLKLIECGANIEAAGNDGRRALHLAVLAIGDADKALIKAGAELNIQDNDGNTPLLLACRHSGEKTVRYLIRSGADASIQNNKGETAMDIAAERGFSDAIEMMMDNG